MLIPKVSKTSAARLNRVFGRRPAYVRMEGVDTMPKPWTSKLIIKALGVQKCNGSLDAATEDLPLEKAMEVAREKGLGHLTEPT